MKMPLLLLSYFFLTGIIEPTYCQDSKIPITTKNSEALEFYKTAFLLEDEGNVKKAEENYRKAIESDTCFALAYMGLALLQNQYAERTKYMAKAMQYAGMVSEGERLWLYGRNAFYGNGKREEEFGFFEKLVNLYPKDPVSQYLYGYMNHHHGRKNFQKAIIHLEKAVELDSRYCIALNDLANAYMEINDFSNAERVLLKELVLLPNNAKPLDTYAEMLMRSGQHERSIEYYKKILEINPGYPWSIFGQAANLNFLARHAEARSLLPAAS